MDTNKSILNDLKENYLSFKGRLNRKPFFIRNMIIFAISLLMRAIAVFVLKTEYDFVAIVFAVILLVYVFFSWWASLSLTVRRLHDIGYSAKSVLPPLIFANIIGGIWVSYGTIVFVQNPSIFKGGSVFFTIVCIVNFIFTLYLFFRKGTTGENKYGEDPLEIKFMQKFEEINLAEDNKEVDLYESEKIRKRLKTEKKKMKTLTEKLYEKSEENYKKFLLKIIPTLNEKNIIGVRIGNLRKFYKTLTETDILQLKNREKTYLEEKLIYAIHISKIKDIDKTLEEIENFIKEIDNWYVCDTMRPKSFRKNHEKVLPRIEKWLESNHEYTVRFAIEMLMVNYLCENYNEKIFEKALYKKSEDYYVQMMQAWCIATMLSEKRKEGIKFLFSEKLSKNVFKKAIQKARESKKIEKEFKKELKRFT